MQVSAPDLAIKHVAYFDSLTRDIMLRLGAIEIRCSQFPRNAPGRESVTRTSASESLIARIQVSKHNFIDHGGQARCTRCLITRGWTGLKSWLAKSGECPGKISSRGGRLTFETAADAQESGSAESGALPPGMSEGSMRSGGYARSIGVAASSFATTPRAKSKAQQALSGAVEQGPNYSATHNLCLTRGLVWCSKCGAYSRGQRSQGLKEVCPDAPRSKAMKKSLARLKRGETPTAAISWPE